MANYQSIFTGPQIDERLRKAGVAVLTEAQSLDAEGKAQARENIGAASASDLASKYTKPADGIPASDLAPGVIPDVSQFVTKSVNDLVNYYLKSDTYTKAEVQALIAAIQGMEFVPVAVLPTASADTLGKIYLVPAANPQTGNQLDEYYTKDNGAGAQTRYTWELFGSAAIDLSNYVTVADLNSALAAYTTTANLTTLLAAKQDVISDLSTIRSGAAAGATAYQKPSTGIPASDLAPGVIPDSEARIGNSVPAPETLIRVDFATEDELPTTKDESDPILAYGTIEVNFDGMVLKKYATIEVQGRSSAAYPKKNWTFAFYDDDQYSTEYAFRLGNMVPHSEYVFKANWIDATHCRNIASNRIWEQIVQSRLGYPKREDEVAYVASDTNILHRFDSGALCHVDGYPCVLYINGAFYGIGDFNIGKKRANYNLNKNTQTQIQIAAEEHANFNSYTVAEWEIRNPKTPDGNFTTRIAPWFASNALTGASFKSGFEATHNLQNAIDYLLFIEFLYADDGVDHNFLLTTWDGEVFSFMPYDLDTVFNLYWDGSKYTDGVGSVVDSDNNITATAKAFWEKFRDAYAAELSARYADLKAKGIFSVGNVYRLCADLTKRYGSALFTEEFAKWTNIPSNTSIHTSIPQILSWVASRLTWMDSEFAAVPLQSLAITGESSVTGTEQYGVTYTPNDTTETGVVWSVQSGSEYASIDQNGLVTALQGADADTVVIRATSSVNSSIYAEKTITVTAVSVVPLVSLSVTGDATVSGSGQYGVTYNPANTTETGVVWSIQSGSAYASIDQNGLVTALEGADSDTVVIRATSSVHSNIYADKTITVTYAASSPVYQLLNYDTDGTESTAIRTNVLPFNSSAFPNGFRIEVSGNVVDNTESGRIYLTCIDETGNPWPGFLLRHTRNIEAGANTSQGSSSDNLSVWLGEDFSGEIIYTPTDGLSINLASVAGGDSVTVEQAGTVSHDWPLCIGGGPSGSGPNTWANDRFASVHFDYIRVYAL